MAKKCIPGVFCIENMTLSILLFLFIVLGYMYYVFIVKVSENGNKQTIVMYAAPANVSLAKILSIYFAVWSPGRIPGTNAPLFFKLSDVSRLLNTKAV